MSVVRLTILKVSGSNTVYMSSSPRVVGFSLNSADGPDARTALRCLRCRMPPLTGNITYEREGFCLSNAVPPQAPPHLWD